MRLIVILMLSMPLMAVADKIEEKTTRYIEKRAELAAALSVCGEKYPALNTDGKYFSRSVDISLDASNTVKGIGLSLEKYAPYFRSQKKQKQQDLMKSKNLNEKNCKKWYYQAISSIGESGFEERIEELERRVMELEEHLQ